MRHARQKNRKNKNRKINSILASFQKGFDMPVRYSTIKKMEGQESEKQRSNL